MKTAVSIPDDVFKAAEAMATRLRVSRSRLYTRALRDYVDKGDEDAMTEAINRVVDDLGDEAVDPAWNALAVETLRGVEWKE